MIDPNYQCPISRFAWDFKIKPSAALLTALTAIGKAYAEATGDDIMNWETSTVYDGEVFAITGAGDCDENISRPNFCYGEGSDRIEVRWYKEMGRSTTVSREVSDEEAVAMAVACVSEVLAKWPMIKQQWPLQLWCYSLDAADFDTAVVTAVNELVDVANECF